jgi:hypothetical protein
MLHAAPAGTAGRTLSEPKLHIYADAGLFNFELCTTSVMSFGSANFRLAKGCSHQQFNFFIEP